MRESLITPSYAQGFARSMGEAANPGLWRGLVGAWMPMLGPTGGTLYDISGYGNHGALTNMDVGEDWVVGEKGTALDFDGSDNYVNLFQPSWLDFTPNADEFTLCAWIKVQSGQSGTILSKAIAAAANRQYQIFVDSGVGQDEISAMIGGTILQTGIVVANGLWHYIVGINYDDSGTKKFRFYIDGRARGGIINSGANTNAYDVLIGARRSNSNTDHGYLFDGLIGPVQIYNRALSPAEIMQLYQDPLALVRMRDSVGFVSRHYGPLVNSINLKSKLQGLAVA